MFMAVALFSLFPVNACSLLEPPSMCECNAASLHGAHAWEDVAELLTPDGEAALSPKLTNEMKDRKDLLFCQRRPLVNHNDSCLKHWNQSKRTDHLLIVLMYDGEGLSIGCPHKAPHKALKRLS